jgi:hypothetical protein
MALLINRIGRDRAPLLAAEDGRFQQVSHPHVPYILKFESAVLYHKKNIKWPLLGTLHLGDALRTCLRILGFGPEPETENRKP